MAKLSRAIARLALTTGIAAPLAAQFVWDGGAGTANWSDAVNWTTDTAPPATAGVIQFAGTVQTTVDLQANRSVASVTFNAGADPFTLQNNTLTLTGTGTILANNSTTLQTVASNLQLTAARTFSATSGNLLYTGGIALSNSATSRILTFTGAGNHTVTGVIANGGTSTAGGLTKTGTGTLTLTAANTYGGQTLVSAGTLRATQAAALGTGTLQVATATLSLAGDTGLTFGRNTTLGGTATFQVDRLSSGAGVTHTLGTLTTGTRTLNLTAGSNITSGTAGLTFGQTNVTGTFTVAPAANTLLTLGPLNATAARTINKNGAGTVLFNGASVDWRTGSALVINNGTARLGASNVFGATGLTNVTVRSNVAGATATLDLNGFNQSILALTFGGTGSTATSFQQVATGAGTLTLGGNVTYTATSNNLGALFTGNLNLGAATRTFSIANSTATTSDLAVSAVISGAAGIGLVKTGTGTLVLGGLNTFSGSTTINAGTVSINSLANVGASSALGAPATAALGTIGIGATTTSATLAYTGTGHTSDRVINLAGTTGGATLSASGSGPLVFTSALTATGAGSKTLTLDGTGTAANTLSGAIVNNSATNLTSLRKTGTGLWIVSGTNTYTGATTLNAGTLRLGSGSSLANSALTVNSTSAGNTAWLDLDGFNATVTALTFGGTGSTATSTHAVTTGTGTLTLGGNVTYNSTGNNLGAVFTGNLNLGAATRTFTVGDSLGATSDLTLNATLTASAGVGLAKAGAGTLTFGGSATYTGATTLTTGILAAGAANAFSAASAHSVATGTTLDLANFDQTIGSLTGSGSVTLGTATLTTGGDNTSTTFSSVLSGTGGLTKTGTGTFTLSGANTFTGPTTVSAGTLALSGNDRLAATTTLSIATGATVNLANNTQTVASLSGGGTFTAGTGAVTIDGSASTTFSGTLSGSGTLVKDGSGTLTLSGTNTRSGPLSLDSGGLALSGASGVLPVSTVALGNGTTLTLDNSAGDNSDRLADSAALTFDAASLVFTSASAGSTETLGLIHAASGNSSVLVNQTGSGAAILTFSGLGTITDGAAVDFSSTGGTLGAAATGPQIYITGLATGFIGGWATVGSDFAEYDAFGVRALTGYYTGSDGINVNNPLSDVILTSGSPSTAFTLTNSGTTTDRTLLLTDIDTVDLNTSATRTLNLAGGGLLKTTATDTVVTGDGRLTAGGTANGTLAVTVQSTGTLRIDSLIIDNAGLDGTYGNPGDGAVKLSKAGPGELILAAANTHTGGTQLDAGTLTFRDSSAPGTGALTLNGGTLRAAGANLAFANSVTLGGNLAFASPDSSTLTFDGPATLTGNRTLTVSTDTTFAGLISQSGGTRTLTKTGAATLTLSGSAANTFTGLTTVNAGTLRLGKTSGVALAGPLLVGDGTGTDTVQFLGSGQLTPAAAVTLGTNGVLDLNNFNQTLSALTVSGGSALTTGTGTLTLDGTFTHNATGTASATLDGNLSLALGTRTFSIGNSAAATDLLVNAVISGSGTLAKTGAGTLALGGANTYSGATLVSAGTLAASAADTFSAASDHDIAAGATLALTDFNQTIGSLAGTGSVTLGTATLTTGATDATTTFSGVLGGTGGLTKSGAGTFTLAAANTFTGATTVSAGTLQISHASALGTTASGTSVSSGATLAVGGGLDLGAESLTLSGPGQSSSGALRSLSGDNILGGSVTLASDATIATDADTLTLNGPLANAGFLLTFASTGDTTANGALSGAGGLAKTGSGTVVLAAANTYDGATTVSAGTLRIESDTGLGTAASGTTVSSGATLAFDGGLTVSGEALTLSGAGVSSGGALRSLSGVNTATGPVTLAAAATLATDADSLTLSGTFDNAGFAVTFASTGDTVLSGVLSGSGALVKTGAGTLTLSGANTYSGATTVSTGTLQIAHATALGATSAGTTVSSGATLALENNISLAAEPLTLSGSGVGGLGALQNTSGDNTLAGAITLAAATLINSLDGSLTLSGSLTLAGQALTFGGDGLTALDLVLAPSTGFTKLDPGTLRFDQAQIDVGTVTLGGGILDLGGLTHNFTTLDVTADSVLEFSGTSTLNLTNLSVASGVTLTVTGWTDLVDFFSATNDPGATILGRVIFTPFSATDTRWQTYDKQITPVPEPSSYGVLSLGLLLGARALRRRRK